MAWSGPTTATAGNSTTSPDGPDDVGKYTSLALGTSGNQVASDYDETNRNLDVLHCNDPNCTGVEAVGGITEKPDVADAQRDGAEPTSGSPPPLPASVPLAMLAVAAAGLYVVKLRRG